MALYTVHIPPHAPSPLEQADKIRFVKEGFSLLAFLLPVIFLLYHRLWLVLLGYMAVLLVFEGLARFLDPGLATALAVLFTLWFALEARGLLRWTLERRGYTLAAIVEAGDAETAELRFFSRWSLQEPQRQKSPPPPTPPPAPSPPIVGLYPFQR